MLCARRGLNGRAALIEAFEGWAYDTRAKLKGEGRVLRRNFLKTAAGLIIASRDPEVLERLLWQPTKTIFVPPPKKALYNAFRQHLLWNDGIFSFDDYDIKASLIGAADYYTPLPSKEGIAVYTLNHGWFEL